MYMNKVIHIHMYIYTMYVYIILAVYKYIYIYFRHPHFTSPEKSLKPSVALQQLTAAQSGLVDGKVLERAAGAFGDFLLHFLRKLLLEVRALVQVDQHQRDLVIWRFPMGIPPNHPLIDGIFHEPSSDQGVPPWLRKPPFVSKFQAWETMVLYSNWPVIWAVFKARTGVRLYSSYSLVQDGMPSSWIITPEIFGIPTAVNRSHCSVLSPNGVVPEVIKY